MRIEKVLLMLVVIIKCVSTQGKIDLGPNLIINNVFSTPNIGITTGVYINDAIIGWNCTIMC